MEPVDDCAYVGATGEHHGQTSSDVNGEVLGLEDKFVVRQEVC